MNNRRNVRQALATFLLQATDIKTVYQGIPSEAITQFPTAIITLPTGKETRVSSGKKRVTYEPLIQVWDLSQSGDAVTDELLFDDLLDQIDTHFRSDPTLGGAVLAAGVLYIDTDMPDPTGDESEIVLVAEKKLDVTVEFNA